MQLLITDSLIASQYFFNVHNYSSYYRVASSTYNQVVIIILNLIKIKRNLTSYI